MEMLLQREPSTQRKKNDNRACLGDDDGRRGKQESVRLFWQTSDVHAVRGRRNGIHPQPLGAIKARTGC